ncbi:MAG: response regulator [Ardenticatenaceae bacterium]
MSEAQCSLMIINGSQEMLELFEEIFAEFGEGEYVCHPRALADIHHIDEIRRIRPDIVLVDQPFGDAEMIGWELVQKIRLARDLKETPVIFMTTNVQLMQELDAQLIALNIRTLLKPFDPDHLLSQVRQALDNRPADA